MEGKERYFTIKLRFVICIKHLVAKKGSIDYQIVFDKIEGIIKFLY